MKRMRLGIIATTLVAALPHAALAFESGSTGADGTFNPTVDTVLDLPPDGIFNFTSVNIPTGVTVTFNKNATNTPVVMLASGDVTVAGTISVAATHSAHVGAAGDGNIGDDGLPGLGGPGGFDGGRGGTVETVLGGSGLGPGGGIGGVRGLIPGCSAHVIYGGSGAGYGGAGGNTGSWCTNAFVPGGAAYGSAQILPLIGGSSGGGGASGTAFGGSGGGGGGGAILIAASGTLNITGSLNADGGWSGNASGQNAGSTGGGGSGGAIRIVATTISGNGAITAAGGGRGTMSNTGTNARDGGVGSVGRIRLEAETITRTAATNPAFTTGAPGPVFIAGMPTLAITSVAGVDAPDAPTGHADITLPADVQNPVTVAFRTTGVPVGNIVALTVSPAYGAPVTVYTPALTGSTDEATASVAVELPVGPSTLQAQTTYTVIASVGDLLGNMYAEGERVEKVELVARLGGETTARLITVSGRSFDAPADALRIAAAGA